MYYIQKVCLFIEYYLYYDLGDKDIEAYLFLKWRSLNIKNYNMVINSLLTDIYLIKKIRYPLLPLLSRQIRNNPTSLLLLFQGPLLVKRCQLVQAPLLLLYINGNSRKELDSSQLKFLQIKQKQDINRIDAYTINRRKTIMSIKNDLYLYYKCY